MKHSDWTDQLRDRLADTSCDVPDELWNRIEQQLDANKPARQTGIILNVKKRRALLAAAASVAVIICSVTAFLLSGNNDTPSFTRLTAVTSTGAAQAHPAPTTPSGQASDAAGGPSADIRRHAGMPKHAMTGHTKAIGGPLAMCTATPPANDAVNTAAEEPGTPIQEEATSGSQTAPHAKKAAPTRHANPAAQPLTAGAPAMGRKANNTSRWDVGLSTTGAAGSYSADGVIMPVSSLTSKNAPTLLKANTDIQGGYQEKATHHVPLSAGMTIAYHLTDRISLKTGIVYTYLSSDFKRGTTASMQTESQKLHYIGVPVDMSYKLWGNRLVATYVQGGIQADFNVSAKMQTESAGHPISRDRMQLSTGAAVGVQVNIVPQIGVYAEPGVRYYFNNNSDIQNIYKEHPCNFSLQVGMRYTLR